MDSKKIGKRLRKLRGEKTLSEVAKSLKIGESTISMWENGERIPRDEKKKEIAKYYNKTVEELFFT